MAETVSGLKETLSIGFLEMSEDLNSRLPTYLASYDAVILSDSSFQYVRSVIDDILQVRFWRIVSTHVAVCSVRNDDLYLMMFVDFLSCV